MSCDISLYDESNNEIMSMNWVRNPFGLLQWITNNINNKDLCDRLDSLINDYAYDDNVPFSHRDLLFDTVNEINKKVQSLDTGRFIIKHEIENRFHPGFYTIEEFEQKYPNYTGRPTLQSYKDWSNELFKFCSLYADNDNYRYYCSN